MVVFKHAISSFTHFRLLLALLMQIMIQKPELQIIVKQQITVSNVAYWMLPPSRKPCFPITSRLQFIVVLFKNWREEPIYHSFVEWVHITFESRNRTGINSCKVRRLRVGVTSPRSSEDSRLQQAL